MGGGFASEVRRAWRAAAAAATEPMPVTCPVEGVYGGGAATWAGGSAGAGLLEKDGFGARLGLGAITGFGGILEVAWLLGFGGKVEAGLPTVEILLVDVRLERDGLDLSGGGLAARRSAITLAVGGARLMMVSSSIRECVSPNRSR